MKNIGFISVLAVLVSFGASADSVVTSKTYVDTKMQSKIATGDANQIPVYTGALSDTNAPTFAPRAIHSANTYTSGTDDDKIPTMGAVMAQIQSSASEVLPTGTENQVMQHNGTAWVAQTMDNTPTDASTKPVTSGGVYTAVAGKQNILPVNDVTNNPSGSLVAYGTTAGTPATKKIVTTVAPNGTDIPTDGAVAAAVASVQSAVTELQNCTHTCADSGCTLISINCVESL